MVNSSFSVSTSAEYFVNEPPRVTLNKLESLGYRVVSMTGVGQTLVWCLHKEELTCLASYGPIKD